MKYGQITRSILAVGVAGMFFLGILMDPNKVMTTLAEIPPAFASAIIWVVVTLGLIWLVVDLASKYLIGKSLREHIADGDTKFEQNLLIVLVIATALALLVGK